MRMLSYRFATTLLCVFACLCAISSGEQPAEGLAPPPASSDSLENIPSGGATNPQNSPGAVYPGSPPCNPCCAPGPWRGGLFGRRRRVPFRPFGSLNFAVNQAQVRNGLVDQLVLYEYDFDVSGGHPARLNRRGRVELQRITFLAQRLAQPVVIQETHENERLDSLRRQNVLAQLEQMQLPAFPELVIVRRVPILGLGAAGEQAFPSANGWNTLYQNRLIQTNDRGSLILLPEFSQ
jgi:hypothetical protein